MVKNSIRSLVLGSILFLPSAARAQSLSVGVKGGVPLTDAFDGSFGVRSEAKRYTVGPTIELGLPLSLAVEVSALYRRTGYSASDTNAGSAFLTQVRANAWEFPILGKLYLPGDFLPVRPFVEAGYVARTFTGVSAVASSLGPGVITLTPLNTSALLGENPTHGIALGGGLRLKAGGLKISPEIRYTRWTGRPFETRGSRGFFVQPVENQADFFLGLRF
jgi:hypothetical protein